MLEFSPLTWDYPPTPTLDLTPENVRYHLEGQVISAINIVNSVIPEIIERGDGSLLFTTGITAFYPLSQVGNLSIAMAALRSYISTLHMELTDKGIVVANRSLGVGIKAGTGDVNDPDVIADMWYQVYSEKISGEDLYPHGVTPATMVY